ncbi:restriction endonuclease subunit S [Nostoc sp. CHAB 5784]|uniref:restriction endonuclease subunit S n=1 Tax=Nostoc mirabile TaxID=2907820 RepID=UPI001E58F886|nr:restriction endonuclease subunit S [Nostoc mirabile]MCC5662508.1 restriction endonuclease subunit S [Nostoc mirabile CHAB5784]
MKEWRKLQLGDIAVISYGYTAKASVENIGLKFLRITDIQNDMVNWSSVPYCQINEDDLQKYKLIDQDIVFARTGATTGKSYLVCDPPEAVAASYLIRLRIQDPTVLPQFISKYFQTSEYWNNISSGISGSAQGGFNASKLSALFVQIPLLSEQKRIVAILDETFEGIDRAIANTEKNLANSRELFESYLNAIFTQKGNGWVEARLGNLSEVQSGGTPLRSKPEYWGGQIAWYSSGELNDLYTTAPERNITDKGLENSNAKLFPKGSLLIGMYDTAALKMSILDRKAAFNQAIAGVKPNDKIDLIFILHAINFLKPEILSLRRGVRQKNLSLQKIKDIVIAVPELQEQQRVVRQLASMREETQRLEAIYRQKIAVLNELKQSILQKAFTGELTADTANQTTKAAKEGIAA